MASAYLFIGRSGCGKGTQAEILKTELEKQKASVLYIETGDIFREFITGDKFANKRSNELYQTAVRQPDFLACFMWTQMLLEKYENGMDVIFDGTPRSLTEAKALETAFVFFGFEKVSVIHLDVSRVWSEKHLLARGRSDDVNMEKITKRLDWYEKDVVPALQYFESSPQISLIRVNGEQSIVDVANEINQTLKLRA